MNKKRMVLALGLALTVGMVTAGESYRLYNVVPMYLGHEKEQAEKCVEMYERTGEDLALYSLTLHPEGRPATDKLKRYVASYRAFAEALKGTKVRAGILVQAILPYWWYDGDRADELVHAIREGGFLPTVAE